MVSVSGRNEARTLIWKRGMCYCLEEAEAIGMKQVEKEPVEEEEV